MARWKNKYRRTAAPSVNFPTSPALPSPMLTPNPYPYRLADPRDGATVTERFAFESLADILAAHDAQAKLPTNTGRTEVAQREWTCSDRRPSTPGDVRSALEAGTFPAGVRRVEAAMADMTAASDLAAPTSRRRRPVMTSEGDELNMGRVWDGDLEHAWRTTRRETTTGPSRVYVAVNMRAASCVGASDLAERGSAVLALTSLLQAAGYTVGLFGVADAILLGTTYRYICEVTLKAPGEELDIHRVANLTTSGMLYRGVIMPHMYKMATMYVHDGLASNPRDIRPDTCNTVGYDRVVVCNELEGNDARKWVEAQIATFGG